jgi:diphthine synthase
MLYIIGIGLNERGISKEGLLAIDKCAKVYLEGYTVDFPYDIKELRLGKKKPVLLKREDVESDKLLKEARGRKIALLVYGSPLFATTHMSLILDAKKEKVKTKIIYSASIFDAVAETGLQLYKFGKITSMPDSDKGESNFSKYIKENQSIKAHSLILVDIDMDFKKALNKLEKPDVKLDKIVVCSQMGNDESQIFYGKINDLSEKEVNAPFCFIIPSELHFMEKEGIERFG